MLAASSTEVKRATRNLPSSKKSEGKKKGAQGRIGTNKPLHSKDVPLPEDDWGKGEEDKMDWDLPGPSDMAGSSTPTRLEMNVDRPEATTMADMVERFGQLCSQVSNSAKEREREGEALTGQIMRQVGDMVKAHMEAIDHRLLPEERLRPPLKGDIQKKREVAKEAQLPSSNTAPNPSQKATQRDKTVKGKKATARNRPKEIEQPKEQRLKFQVGAGKDGKAQNVKVPSPAEQSPCDRAGKPSYSSVLKKGKPAKEQKSQVSSQSRSQQSGPNLKRTPETGSPSLQKQGEPAKKGRKRRKKQRKSAAVVLSQPLNVEEGKTLSLAEIVSEATSQIDLTSLEIEYIRPKRAVAGGLILEIPGASGEGKADSLASRLREVLGDKARVQRPSRKLEIKISRLDESATSSKVAEAIAREGGCKADEIKVGEVSRASDGLFFAWARCPEKAAQKVADKGNLRVGWMKAKVALLSKRPLQCHRCLEVGHVRQDCKGPDRSGACYRCGREGHVAAKCTAAPLCMLCDARGDPAVHRMGSNACPSTKRMKRKEKPRAKSAQAKNRPIEGNTPSQAKEPARKGPFPRKEDPTRVGVEGQKRNPPAKSVNGQAGGSGKKGKGKSAQLMASSPPAEQTTRTSSRAEGQEEAMLIEF